MTDKFELYHVRYLVPVFGSDGSVFNNEVHEFMVSTPGGKSDAKEACKKYHAGCKIISVVTHLEDLAGLGNLEVTKYMNKQSKKQIKRK